MPSVTPPCDVHPVNVDLSPAAIGMLDTAYLGLLSLYGQFPRSIKSVLFTAAMYGLPAVLNLLGMEDKLPAIQHFPKYASRLGMLYSGVSSLAVFLIVLACIPACYKLMQSDAVQDAVHSAIDGGKQDRPTSGVGVASSRARRDGKNGAGYDAGEDDEVVDGEDEEEEDDAEPIKPQKPQARTTRPAKVKQ